MKATKALTYTLLSTLTAISSLSVADTYVFDVNPDALSGPVTSTLNSKERPTGINESDRVHIKNGHFYTVGTNRNPGDGDDRRVRLWGINVVGHIQFPRVASESNIQVDEATLLAERFSELGFNIVRFHGLDSLADDTRPEKSLFSEGPYPTINYDNLDRLDRFIAELGKKGIYTNLNLKAFHKFTPEDCYTQDGVTYCVPDPAWVDPEHPERTNTAMPTQSKPIDLFNDEMIELQKRLISELLEHINPYTTCPNSTNGEYNGHQGCKYKDDPRIALLEINNENSLINQFSNASETLPPIFAKELDDKWNQWLLDKYLDTSDPACDPNCATERMRTAWIDGTAPLTFQYVTNSTFSDNTSGWTTRTGLSGITYSSYTVNTEGELVYTIDSNPPAPYYISLIQYNLPGVVDQSYVIQFTGRADHDRSVVVEAKQNSTGDILSTHTVKLSNVNSRYNLCFDYPLGYDITDIQLNLHLGKGTGLGNIYIDDVEYHAGGPLATINDNENLVDMNVARFYKDNKSCHSYAQKTDYLDFLTTTEESYYQTIVNHAKNTNRSRQVIAGTQANYGGWLGNKNMTDTTDYIDTHYYWDHPSWPDRTNKTRTDWWMHNLPLVNDPSSSMISRIVSTRVDGMPYTISEYNSVPSNQYSEDGYPIMASLASAQDIDGVFIYTYYAGSGQIVPGSTTSRDLRNYLNPNSLINWFNFNGETRSEVITKTASNIFRRSDVSSLSNSYTLPISTVSKYTQMINGRTPEQAIQSTDYLMDPDGDAFDVRLGISNRIYIQHNDSILSSDLPNAINSLYISDNNDYSWITDESNGSHFIIDTDRTKAMVGYINGVNTTPTITISGANPGQFGAVLLTSNDDLPINTSRDMLLTTVSAAINSNGSGSALYVVPYPGIDGYLLCDVVLAPCPDGHDWTFFNYSPLLVYTNPVTVDIRTAASNIIVQKLDTNGNPVSAIQTTPIDGGYRFSITDFDHSPWYHIATSFTDEYTHSLTLEAENYTQISPTNNTIGYNPDASNGAFFALGRTGSVTLAIPEDIIPGMYYVNAAARAQEFDGPAKMRISLDGSELGTSQVTDSLGFRWQTYSVTPQPIYISNANQTITIEFLNDAYGGIGHDRNLYVDKVDLYLANTQPHGDLDNDGASNDVDCNDLDPTVFPGALEIAFDGIDQNCAGGDATIVVHEAHHKASTDTFSVEASYTGGGKYDAPLHVEGYPTMFWNNESNAWRMEAWNIETPPVSIRITGPEGTIEHTDISSQ